MAKIRDSKGRGDENSGYVRVVGSVALGALLSRVQATVIRNGYELGNALAEHCPYYEAGRKLLPFDPSQSALHPVQVFFNVKLVRVNDRNIVGDVVVVDHRRRSIDVIELKDGDAFDTKKASGELASIKELATVLGTASGYEARAWICAFNQPDKSVIVKGLKGRFDVGTVMTGEELCQLIGVDYEHAKSARDADQAENLTYMLREIAAIPEVREVLVQILAETAE